MKDNDIPLVAKGIYKKYGSILALSDINLDVFPDSTFGLVGLNGAGKTTLIKIIVDLIRANKGQIKIYGKHSTNTDARKNIFYLPEKFTPSSCLHGWEFLSLSSGYFNVPYFRKEAESLCENIGLDPMFLYKPLRSYSKGMTQKIGLIAAFISKARFLILDEPMSGLDPGARMLTKRMIKNHVNNGASILFSSHVLADVDELCDKMAVMHEGCLNFCGSVKEFSSLWQENSLENSFLRCVNFIRQDAL